ncbi:MAG: divalent-cation tolerance protein CutA [Acidiferrobacterales bacterium]|nr:divalent-cation tolerance protein CutA [Acidiferrobacterales bacterium]
MDKSNHLVVYCTCPEEKTAEKIARALVTEGLAACANILPGVKSVYRWKGQIESVNESLLLIKINSASYENIERRIVELHPYELPEVIGVPITAGLEPYLAWLTQPE